MPEPRSKLERRLPTCISGGQHEWGLRRRGPER